MLISRYGRFAPVTLAEPLARGIAPIIGEAPHQMRNHRPAQTKVQIVTGLARRIGPPIRTEDVHAAGETRLAIDHQQLAVIAQMCGMQARGNQRRVERRRRNAGALQGAVGAAGRPAGIHVVDQHPHLHAALMSPAQRIDELRPDALAVEDVRGQGDAVPRRFDGGEHGRVGLLAIDKRLDAVAAGQRLAGGASHQVGQTGKRRRYSLGHRGREVLPNSRICPREEPPRPPLVTVDAEQPIQQRTAQRQQGDQQYPQRGRSRLTLVDNRVPRCGDSDRQRHEGGCPCQPVGVGHDSLLMTQDSPPADFFLRAGLLASLGGVSAAFAASGFSGSAGFAGGSWRSKTTRSALSSQRALA